MSNHENHQAGHKPHVLPLSVYFGVFVALIVLLILTVGASTISLSPALSATLALTIATSKAILIILYFMHVKYSSKLVWAYAAVGFFGLILLLAILMADYVGRGGVESLTRTSFLITGFV